MRRASTTWPWWPSSVALAAVAFAAALLAPRVGLAIGPSSEIALVLATPGSSAPSPAWLSAFDALGDRVREITSVPLRRGTQTLPLARAAASGAPFVVLPLDRLPEVDAGAAAAGLQAWLASGGTLWILNGAPWETREAVNTWTRAFVAAIDSRYALRPVPADSVVFRSFFVLQSRDPLTLEGVQREGRWAVLYAPFWVPATHGKAETAMLQLATNVLEYVLCGTYKDEQTHIDYLLKRRNWKLD